MWLGLAAKEKIQMMRFRKSGNGELRMGHWLAGGPRGHTSTFCIPREDMRSILLVKFMAHGGESFSTPSYHA